MKEITQPSVDGSSANSNIGRRRLLRGLGGAAGLVAASTIRVQTGIPVTLRCRSCGATP
jgi:hypothetical protein